MQHSQLQNITEQCQHLLKNIEFPLIQNIYSKFNFYYINYFDICKDEANTSVNKVLLNFLNDYKFITYDYSKLPESIIFSKNRQQINTNSSNKIVDAIICVEKQCLIIEGIDIGIIEEILLNTKSTLIKSNSEEKNNYLSNLYAKFIKDIKLNPFLKFTYKTIICYSIFRYFYPSNYFKDQSFFFYNQNKSIEERIQNNFIQMNQGNNQKEFQTKIFSDIKTIQKENQNKPHYQIFNQNDFIYIKTLHIDKDYIYHLAIHIESLYLFAIEEIHELYDYGHNFKREINFCKNYSHRCFTPFYGFIKDNNETTGLVYEYMCNGTLPSYIRKNKEKITNAYSFMTLMRIIEGIDFLNSNSLVHRDIKPLNILIDHNSIPHISDFETIKSINENDPNDSQQNKGTTDFYSNLYGSPEIYYRDQVISNPADVFSLGAIIYFLFEKKDMFKEKTLDIFENIKNGDLPKISNASDNIQYLYNSCLKYEIKKRIQFSSIKNIIKEEIKSFYYFEDYITNANYNGIGSDIIYYFIESIFFLNDDINLLNHYLQNVFKFQKLYLIRNENDYPTFLLQIGNLYFKGDNFDVDFKKSKHYYELSSELNNYKALNNLGFLYENGIDVKQDFKKALEYYEKSSKQNYSNALFNLGYLYYTRKGTNQDIEKAVKYFEQASEQNDSNSQFILGIIYYFGKFQPKNIKKAIKYFKKSSKNINTSNFIIGYIYLNSDDYSLNSTIKYFDIYYNNQLKESYSNNYLIVEDGIQSNYFNQKEYFNLIIQSFESINLRDVYLTYFMGDDDTDIDYVKAKYYAELCSHYNDPESFCYLGVMYEYGLGVKIDIEKAKKYYGKSALLNCAAAFYRLGNLYFKGKGLKQDFSKAKEYLEIAAHLNDPDALNQLGVIYDRGLGVEVNINKAIEYYKLALKQDNPYAYYNLGNLYLTGNGLPQDFINAKECFEKSAEYNYEPALLNLAIIYENGFGVKKNHQKAMEYLENLSNNGYIPAFCNLGRMYELGLGVPKDLLRAKFLYEKGANLGDSNALCFLGLLYYTGKGVKQDISKAIDIMTLAANQKNVYSYSFLGSFYLYSKTHKNIEKGIEYMKKAAIKNSNSLFLLGEEYLTGKIVKKDILKGLIFLDKAAQKNNTYSLIYLGDIYSSGIYFDADYDKAIQYYKKCIEIKTEPIFIGPTINNLDGSVNLVANRNYSRSNNDLGLIYITAFNDLDLAKKYIKIAAYNEYPFAQNNLGLIFQFFDNNEQEAEYFYKKSSKHKLLLSTYNLGKLYETQGNIEDAVKKYLQALEYENELFKYKDDEYDDQRLKKTTKFIACFIRLKLILYYYSKEKSQSKYAKTKKIFIDAINQLVEESEKYNYHLFYHGYYFSDNEIDEIKSLISFVKNYIIKSPLFNLENQPNNDIFLNYQQHLTLKSDRDESLDDDSKIDKDKFSHSNQKDETKNDEMIDVDKVCIEKDDTTICNDSNSMFDIIFQKEELIVSFIKSIEEIVEIIDNILYTPPYPILFGRISINKKKLDTNQIKKPNPLSKNINKSFYNGFGIDI